MTLRLRLVIALLVLVTIGLGVFGFVTYSLYARSEYNRIDDQLARAAPFTADRLLRETGIDNQPNRPTFSRPEPSTGGNPGGGGTGPRTPPVALPSITYAEVRDSTGQVLGTVSFVGSESEQDVPDLPDDLTASDSEQFFTTGSVDGSTPWRVYVSSADAPSDDTLVLAQPLTEVAESLDRLVLIEVAAGLVLLALLGTGSWFILRHGLRPLEHMADSARTITAGDLSERVTPADDHTEVGELGLAINTMLAEIEDAFRERDATERRLRQFLADASHELRTPLTSIQGFAELFRMGADEDKVRLAVILRRIEEESDRMKVLVEELLLLARLDETRPAARAPVDLAVLAADACSDAVAQSPNRPVTLDAPSPVVVSGDTDHLRQAIANLVTNAITHTPDGSPVEVSATLVDGRALVSVRDHGPGLDADALEHAFDRFWRADGSRVGTGTGLGLSIVSGIAEEHGGAASVMNEPDGGARFSLVLPVA